MKHVALALTAVMLSAGVVSAQEEAETDVLASTIAAGLTLNDGNTDNSMATASLTLDYNPDEHHVSRLALDFAYGETDGDKSTENGKAAAEYKRIFDERAYGTFNASAEYDEIADLDYRWLVAPGLGYYIFKQEKAYLFIEAGVGVKGEEKSGIDQGEKVIARVAQRYERVTDSGAKYWQSVEYIPLIDDASVYVLNAEIGAEAPLSEKLNLRVVLKDTYDSDPAAGAEENDLTLIAGLSFTLL